MPSEINQFVTFESRSRYGNTSAKEKRNILWRFTSLITHINASEITILGSVWQLTAITVLSIMYSCGMYTSNDKTFKG